MTIITLSVIVVSRRKTIMKRVLNDTDFRKSMIRIEKETAKIFGIEHDKITASWNGDNKIEVVISE